MREIIINGHRIADAEPCYVIAELGHNHGGSFATAQKLILSAAASGADAVKLQKRDNASLYSQSLLDAPYENEHSFGKTYGEHRKALEFGAQDYLGCRAVAQSAQIDFFATAFDEPSVDFLMQVGVPALKIASGGLTDHRLLRYASQCEVPLIVSTGGGTWADVDAAVDTLAGRCPFALLHCTAAYPVLNDAELNLLAIVEMRRRYPDVVIGWSGHDAGVSMSLIAYAYGARMIEKHVTLNRASKGTDHAFSLEPKGLHVLCEDLKRAHVARGDGVKRFYDSERKPIAKMRRTETAFGPRITGRDVFAHH